MLYGLTHKDDKKKMLATDHWGNKVLFETLEEAEKFTQEKDFKRDTGWFLKNSEWTVRPIKMKRPKKIGRIDYISTGYFEHNT
jgi:hypothetical protein